VNNQHRRFDVAVLGALHLDIMVEGAPLPREDETVFGSSWHFKCGGKGGNQAVAAARFGARTMMMGRVGADEFGRQLLANLSAEGVDHRHVAIDAATRSGMSVAIVDATGTYGAAVVSGANQAIHGAADDIGAAVLLLQNEIPDIANARAANAAKQQGSLVILNAAPMRPMSGTLLASIDLLIANRVEASALAGHAVESIDAASSAISNLGNAHSAMIITLGRLGCVVKPLGGKAVHLAARSVQAVSTHGAGDCFAGALAARLAAGADLVEAARFATVAASLFVARDETAQALLTAEDVTALLA
jgi:ribokinase